MEDNKIVFDVLYEDKDVLVINKPAGLVVHPDGKTKEKTLTGWLIEQYPDIASVGEALALSSGEVIDRPGIVHRLDRETSGVMVIAKNQTAHSLLKEQFQGREIEKEYRTFVYGRIKEDRGTIDRPIGKSKGDFRRWSAQPGARGELREAVTHFEVLKRGTDVTYLLVRPETGRTHQIRVHFKAIHHPVVCDRLYAPTRACLLGFGRLALHAHRLSVTLPKGERKMFEAPMPSDFERALTEFK